MASRIGKVEWLALYVFAGTIDVVQFFGDLLLTEAAFIPELISEVADPFIGTMLGGYLQFRGTDIIHKPKRILSLMGVTGLEELTGGMAPAWVIDIWYIHRDVRNEEAGIKTAQAEMLAMKSMQANPLYSEGRRRPVSEATAGDEAALNFAGVRLPRKI